MAKKTLTKKQIESRRKKWKADAKKKAEEKLDREIGGLKHDIQEKKKKYLDDNENFKVDYEVRELSVGVDMDIIWRIDLTMIYSFGKLYV